MTKVFVYKVGSVRTINKKEYKVIDQFTSNDFTYLMLSHSGSHALVVKSLIKLGYIEEYNT